MRSARLILLPLILPLMLVGCTTFPQLEGTIPPAQSNASFPELVPLTPIIAQSVAPARTVPALPTGRIAGLRARAAALRGPVIAPPLRNRMLRGLR